MAGGTQLEARPVEPRPAEPVALTPPQPHQPHEPPASRAPISPPPPSRSRRLFLRAAFTLGVIGGTAAALLPVFRADPREAGSAPAEAGGPQAAERFDEMYGGRHIQGTDAGVRIDGRPLHVMRRADGSYLSVVNHYESFPTALATARAAVDDLGGAQLSLAGPASH
ncbi:tyrosinase family oxidase copper chaperone [Streptomyces sp. NBC_01506]|uniref:tyrosinase family oxidase copper chaperone n=1 Tax=Streptomyces sp. NBC_01506 TaxID=2903887 RepID=UPI0038680718